MIQHERAVNVISTQATTVDHVRGLEREEVSQVDGPSSADRRKLWLFCVAQREALETAVAHSA